jgi:hypothetical protein
MQQPAWKKIIPEDYGTLAMVIHSFFAEQQPIVIEMNISTIGQGTIISASKVFQSVSSPLRHHSRDFFHHTLATRKTQSASRKMKERLLIVGSGWAGSTVATEIDERRYSVSLISPESSLSYTPLLASAACGLYDFSLVHRPIRHASKHTKILKASVESIDFKAKSVKCRTACTKTIDENAFALEYDILVLAPGVSPLAGKMKTN